MGKSGKHNPRLKREYFFKEKLKKQQYREWSRSYTKEKRKKDKHADGSTYFQDQ